jgi:hypothetical protein
MHYYQSKWASTNVNTTKLMISWHLKMGPVLVTEGELHQTKRYTQCQWCVKGNVAGAGASNDGKPTNNGAVGWGFNKLNTLPDQSAF